MKNPDTYLEQIALKHLGFYAGDLDGDRGPITRASRARWDQSLTPASGVHHVNASSFADLGDVAAFKRCKAQGGTDQECFRVGDNAIGKWGDSTAANVPMCALPPEDWQHLGKAARGAKVLVKGNGREVVCELRDTMPHKANIKNFAGIDLNPAAVAALGLVPPIMIPASWEWV